MSAQKIGPKEAALAKLRGQPPRRRLSSGIPKPTAPIRDQKYLKWLRSNPCALTGKMASDSESVVAAHVGGSMGSKRGDNEALPLAQSLHVLEHQRGTAWLMRNHASDDFLVAAARAYAHSYYTTYIRRMRS